VSVTELRALIDGATTNGNGRASYAITFTDSKPPKMVLPDVPAHDDPTGLAAWLTGVLQLDPAHPVVRAVHEGLRGPEGHVEIRRARAAPIRFEPAAAMNSARRFLPVLAWQLLPTDGEPPGFRDEHCRRIAHVVRLLCGVSTGVREADETAGIVGVFLAAATALEGHTTYGTGAQRYEAATALQRAVDDQTGRPLGPARYLIDLNTGELVIRAGDLQAAARAFVGSSLPRGWLDARLANLGWQRLTLDGHALAGREGRGGPHARTVIYRGHLTPEEGSVTT